MDLEVFVRCCQEALWRDEPLNRLAGRYLLNERGLSERTITDHSIGYCEVTQELPGDSAQQEQNLVLSGRIIVPIYGEFGNLVAVAGRHPNPKNGGWWNTSFDKNNHIFLFDRSRKSAFDENKLYLFEGYMDALVLYQEGLVNVGSVMGTTVGYRRIGLIKRYCNRVCLVFDQDVNLAGQRAHDRSVFELSRFHFDEISHITLPLKVDPDEFVLKHGVEEFLALETQISDEERNAAIERYLNRESEGEKKQDANLEEVSA